MYKDQIIEKLPYSTPFLFVDKVVDVDEEHITGEYTFTEDEFFYKGHFVDNPITPGVILTECMAQIGLACFGIYLLKDAWDQKNWSIAMTSNEMNFYKPVFPKEKVIVVATKIYFRFNKLKCQVTMYTKDQTVIAKGNISGMAFKK
ncbi:3-hydroxyacyl-ACP dehydratase FabZ family protein [Aquimarina pacifica]|uniref:3-hydroxyacyl-ACP dehydratase FabZ family protein n=1 Tax=Aquimarina pacifica TaxID=1296415 RepID=UPI0004722BAA|nr:hydroxymyristoyl-ACP dehydratase [Aquimarina pacifica]